MQCLNHDDLKYCLTFNCIALNLKLTDSNAEQELAFNCSGVTHDNKNKMLIVENIVFRAQNESHISIRSSSESLNTPDSYVGRS